MIQNRYQQLTPQMANATSAHTAVPSASHARRTTGNRMVITEITLKNQVVIAHGE